MHVYIYVRTPVWVEFSFARWRSQSPQEVLADSTELSQLLGLEFALHYYMWYSQPRDGVVNELTPQYAALNGVRDVVNSLQSKHRVNVVLYTNGRFADMRINWPNISSSACHQHNYNPILEGWEAGVPPYALMNPAEPQWQRILSDAIAGVAHTTDSRGVYIDQLSSYYPQPCYPLQTNGISGAWAAGTNKLLRASAEKSGAAILSESNAEAYIGSVHGNLALYGWRRCGYVPAFQAVYSGYTVNIGKQNWPSLSVGNGTMFRATLARQAVFGHVLGWFALTEVLPLLRQPEHQHNLKFIQALGTLRANSSRFLVHGRMIRPPIFGTSIPSMPVCHPMEGCCNVSQVLASAWLATNGDLGLLVINWGDTALNVDIRTAGSDTRSFRLSKSVSARTVLLIEH